MDLVRLGTGRGAIIRSIVPCSYPFPCALISALTFLFLTYIIAKFANADRTVFSTSQFARPPRKLSIVGTPHHIQAEVKPKVLKTKRQIFAVQTFGVQTAIFSVQTAIFGGPSLTMFSTNFK